MENLQMYIVLAITIFMIVSFLIGKWPYGLTTMTCCALLGLTGVMDPVAAFGGVANKTTILIAGMFVVAYAFGKTSLITRIRKQMERIKGKNGLALMLFLFGITIVLSQLMGRTAVLSIMILFISSLDEADEMSPSRMITACFAMIAIWNFKFPIASGAMMPSMANAMYEGIVSDPSLMLGTWDFFKVSMIPGIVLTIYTLLFWKLIPSHPVDTSNVKDVAAAKISKKDEICISVVFIGVMVVFFLGTKIGNLMYVAPAIGAIVLLITKSLTTKEVIDKLTGDMTWMIAGVLVMSDAMGQSGVGELIGDGILSVLGAAPSGIMVLLVFGLASIVMTTFMSNTGTQAILTPIAASMALAGGMDPRGIVLMVQIGAVLAIAFPSGSAECALMFAAGRHNPVGLLKFTIPFLILALITLTFSINLFFPVYP